ncbi:hypothetical protein BaRGS_00038022 [Batillaria attramentaria]|uniref:Uncharacterized protein n=1 Tax=Batillaria attramentaria TaxID=370345 RepID=A0ABD0J7A8_9CAEN
MCTSQLLKELMLSGFQGKKGDKAPTFTPSGWPLPPRLCKAGDLLGKNGRKSVDVLYGVADQIVSVLARALKCNTTRFGQDTNEY